MCIFPHNDSGFLTAIKKKSEIFYANASILCTALGEEHNKDCSPE